MPVALDVDHDQARMLVLEIGYKAASDRTGIPYDTLRQWGSREGWFKPKQLPPTMQPVTVTGVTKPADALSEIMQEHNRETRLDLALTARRNAAQAKEAGLDAADKALATGKLAALVHGWQDGSASGVSVNILFQQS